MKTILEPEMPETPHLDQILTPSDLKGKTRKELDVICDELRVEMIDAVSRTGKLSGRRHR